MKCSGAGFEFLKGVVVNIHKLSSLSGLAAAPGFSSRGEAMYVEQVLAHCRGDMRKAADIAGLSRGHMYELLKNTAKTKHERECHHAEQHIFDYAQSGRPLPFS